MEEVSSAASHAQQAPNIDEYSCHICYGLLVDPVVGNCGHDACRHCITRWARRHTAGRVVKCPLCRNTFARGPDDLGVCIRLRETLERLFPEQLAARKAEVRLQEEQEQQEERQRQQEEQRRQQQRQHEDRAQEVAAMLGAVSDPGFQAFMDAFMAIAGTAPRFQLFDTGALQVGTPDWLQRPARAVPAPAQVTGAGAGAGTGSTLAALPSGSAGGAASTAAGAARGAAMAAGGTAAAAAPAAAHTPAPAAASRAPARQPQQPAAALAVATTASAPRLHHVPRPTTAPQVGNSSSALTTPVPAATVPAVTGAPAVMAPAAAAAAAPTAAAPAAGSRAPPAMLQALLHAGSSFQVDSFRPVSYFDFLRTVPSATPPAGPAAGPAAGPPATLPPAPPTVPPAGSSAGLQALPPPAGGASSSGSIFGSAAAWKVPGTHNWGVLCSHFNSLQQSGDQAQQQSAFQPAHQLVAPTWGFTGLGMQPGAGLHPDVFQQSQQAPHVFQQAPHVFQQAGRAHNAVAVQANPLMRLSEGGSSG